MRSHMSAFPMPAKQRHKLRKPAGDRIDPVTVIRRSDRACAMRSMSVGVLDVSIPTKEIPPMDVVNKPVAVVVDAVAGNLPGIGPQVRRKVGVVDLYSGIKDGYGNARASRVQQSPRRSDVHLLESPLKGSEVVHVKPAVAPSSRWRPSWLLHRLHLAVY